MMRPLALIALIVTTPALAQPPGSASSDGGTTPSAYDVPDAPYISQVDAALLWEVDEQTGAVSVTPKRAPAGYYMTVAGLEKYRKFCDQQQVERDEARAQAATCREAHATAVQGCGSVNLQAGLVLFGLGLLLGAGAGVGAMVLVRGQK